MLSIQDKELFLRGTTEDKKKVLKDKLKTQTSILKSASDINTLMKAQGAVQVLESLLSSFD